MKKILNLWPVLILIFISLVFFHQVLFNNYMFVTPAAALGDITLSNIPYRMIYQEAYHALRMPLWTDAIFAGYPIIGDPSNHIFFPLSFIAIFFFSPSYSYNLNIAVYFLLMSIFTYLYIRTLGISSFAALLASIAFSYSGFLTTKIMHAHFIATVMWFPLILFAVEKLLATAKLRYLLILVVGFSLQILSNHPQMMIYCTLVVTVYFLVRWMRSVMPLRQKVAIFLSFSLSLLMGIAISAVSLVPAAEFLSYSERAKGIGTDVFNVFPFHPKELITLFWPYFYGNPANATYLPPSQERSLFWENSLYIGLIPVILSILSFAKLRSKKGFSFFLILAIVTLLLSFGKYTPLSFILEIPPFSFFRVPSRLLFFVIFSLAILTGVGADWILSKYHKYQALIIPTIIIVTVVDLYIFCYSFNVLDKTDKWLETAKTAEFLKKDTSFYRIYSIDIPDFKKNPFNQAFAQANGWKENLSPHRHLFNYLPPNANILYGLPSAGGYVALAMQRSVDVQQAIDAGITVKDNKISIAPSSLSLLRIFDVKYLISPFDIDGKDLNLRMQTRTGHYPEFSLYEIHAPFPQAFLVNRYVVQNDPHAALEILRDERFDSKNQVILEKELKFPQGKELDHQKNKVLSVKRRDNGAHILIQTQTQVPSILVLTDTYYPGWKARIDGKEVPIYQADYVFRAIVLPSGKHTVKFSFEPLSITVGGFISLGALVTLCIFIILLYKRKQNIYT